MWVSEELDRASKTQFRSRGEMRVHEVRPAMDHAADVYGQMGRELGMIPGGREYRYKDALTGEEVEIFYRPGRILSVGGKPDWRQIGSRVRFTCL